jgi:hypothetical protein
MAFLDHEGGAEFPYTREDVLEALIKAIPTVSGLTVHSADKLSGRVLVKAGVSLMFWGENIPISVVEMSTGRTRVSITSTPKTGVLFGGAFDLGKNRKNIEQVFGCTHYGSESKTTCSSKKQLLQFNSYKIMGETADMKHEARG